MNEMQRIVLASRPDGVAGPENFRLESAPMPEPGAEEVLVRCRWLSLDPYMRGRMDAGKSYASPVEIGDTMEGRCVGEVLISNSDRYKPGDHVVGAFGWATHGVAHAKALIPVDPDLAPVQTALGVLGMPGMTAWSGLNQLGKPKEGETLVVAAATGAVGSMVGQLAKLKGLRAVGIAGGPEKCAFAVEELGFDACIDHRQDVRAIREQVAGACPDGIDLYFENVGGDVLEAVIPLLNQHARVPVCGMISWYDLDTPPQGPDRLPMLWRAVLVKRLQVEGFIVSDFWHLFGDFRKEVGPMVRDGRIRYRESVAEGLEAAPDAFLAMLKGGNFGKQLVRL